MTILRIDSGVSLPGEGNLEVAAEIVPSASGGDRVFVCLPGGAMNRRYWDIVPPDGSDSYSFARQMARRGFTSVLIDHLGVGESDRPADGYALTTGLLAQANARVTGEVLRRLREGGAGIEAMPGLKAFGIGHSMGAMLAIVQQARFAQYAGIAALGFTTRGLAEYLPPAAREMDDAQRREEVVELARGMFRVPYPVLGRSGDAGLYAGKAAEPAGVEGIKAARDVLLPVPAFAAMLPGNVAAEAAVIEVPVFIGVGERDMTGPPADIPAAFRASRAVTFHELPGAGHSHFLFPARAGLFDALAQWAAAI